MLKPESRRPSSRSPSRDRDGRGNKHSSRPKSVSKKQASSKNGNGQLKTGSRKEKDLIIASEKPAGVFRESFPDLKTSQQDSGVSSEEAQIINSSVGDEQGARNKFSHSIYDNAAKIYSYLRGEITSSAIPSFKDEYQKRRAYSIAFATKRYEEVLKDVLLDSHFYSSYSKMEALCHNNVMVLLMDFYDHDFRFSDSKRIVIAKDTVNPQEQVTEIQEAILNHSVHLCAAFARSRIKECALSLEQLLSEETMEATMYAHHQPLYARINTLKATTDAVISMLVEEGYKLADNMDLIELTGKTFRRDPHFDDLLVFSKDCKDDIYSHNITIDQWLYPQEKSKIVVVEAMKFLLVEMAAQKDKTAALISGEMKSFMADGDDILLTNPDSASLLTHLASLLYPERKLFICGCLPDLKDELERKMMTGGVRNFELIEESFINIPHNDERFKRVKFIICNMPCSKSGVVNPVDFILQEGNITAKLLSGKVETGKQRAIIADEYLILRHALKYSQVQSILYSTLSNNDAENDDLVFKTLKEYREEASSKSPFQLAPLLPELAASLRSHIQGSIDGIHTTYINSEEKYLKLQPSSYMNGCFIALLKRQLIEPTAKDVLERTSKKGPMTKNRGQKKSITHVSKNPKVIEKEEEPQTEQRAKKESTNTMPFQKFF